MGLCNSNKQTNIRPGRLKTITLAVHGRLPLKVTHLHQAFWSTAPGGRGPSTHKGVRLASASFQKSLIGITLTVTHCPDRVRLLSVRFFSRLRV